MLYASRYVRDGGLCAASGGCRPQLTGLLKPDHDWTDDVRGLPMPVLIVAGDADGLPPRHAVEFFELLGGGKRDAVWDRSGMTRHGLAILPRATHYDINVAPAIATSVASFLDEVQACRNGGFIVSGLPS